MQIVIEVYFSDEVSYKHRHEIKSEPTTITHTTPITITTENAKWKMKTRKLNWER